jgi:hypothetical protein
MAVANQQRCPEPCDEPDLDPLVELVLDGGPRLGFGHLGRCLALWEELEGRAAFRVTDASVAGQLRARGAHTVLAGTWEASAPLGGAAPVVVLDRAAPAAVGEVRSLRAGGRRVALLDDLGPARMLADLVIDPPTAAVWPAAAGRRLAGFEHVLLRREVRAAASSPTCALAAEGPRARGGVLLAMGGSDPAGLTPALAEILGAAGCDPVVALGPGYRGPSPTVGTVLGDPGGFVAALARAELLVTGYGHSLLEAAHLGVPAVAAVHRPEHLPHARAFCRAGTARMLDLTAPAGGARLGDLAVRLLAGRGVRARMAARGRELVDGLGAGRVVVALEALA